MLLRLNLTFVALLSTLITVIWAPGPATAHEVRPAIADMVLTPDRVTLDIRLTVEAMLANIDLSEIEDTDEAANAADYDALRALPPEEVADQLRAAWDSLAPKFTIESGGERVLPTLTGVEVGPIGDVEWPRDTTLSLAADLPASNAPVLIGWSADLGNLVLRQFAPDGVEIAEEDLYTKQLRGGELSDPLPRTGGVSQSAISTFWDYIVSGFDHIIPKGLDHILFVLGLFLLSFKLRPLLIQVTTFTLAHSVTLALGILGIINLPPEIVEPLIAASIVYVAVENIVTRELSPWRPVIVFAFGLLHGLGFASVLSEFGLAPGAFVLSLIAFNIGVELGQLAVIAIAFVLLALPFGQKPWYRRAVTIPLSVVIGLIAFYWVLDRTILPEQFSGLI